MKNIFRNTLVVAVSVLVINAAYAENDGGLMATMMVKKFPAQVITDPAAQVRLAQVKLPTETHQNGGLMKEMSAARFPVKTIYGVQVQDHLSQVQIPVGN